MLHQYYRSVCKSEMWNPLLLRYFIVLLSVTEVHQLSFPYISFMGETLLNHAFVNLSLVGEHARGIDSIQCHTDLPTCCSSVEGEHGGAWYHPDGSSLPDVTHGGVYETHSVQRVDMQQEANDTSSPSGIYRCDIPTVAVHDDHNYLLGESVHVGLYYSGGWHKLCS